MWIFHPLGFCSAVVDQQVPGNLLCRARVRKDLVKLFPDYAQGIRRTPKSDYLFRVSVPREQVAARIAEMVEGIDYGNFKDACPQDRHDAYLRVWTAMYQLQPRRRRMVTARRVAHTTFDDDLDYWYGVER